MNEWGEKRKEPDIERGNGRENELGVGERESGGMSGGLALAELIHLLHYHQYMGMLNVTFKPKPKPT